MFDAAVYRRGADGRTASTLRALLDAAPALDPEGVRFAWGEAGESERTVVRGVHRLSPPEDSAPPDALSLDDRFLAATARALDGGARVAVSLSGGLDSALLLAWVRALGHSPPVYVLSPRIDGAGDYDETAAARAIAAFCRSELTVVEVGEEDFVAALPACVAAAEAPLYNLHPVGKLLLARRLAADGIEVVLTGDGADQVLAGAPAAIYLPIVSALLRSGGVEPRSPFLDRDVRAWARTVPRDPDKRRLRELGRGRIPDEVAAAPKRPRLAPPMDVWRHLDLARAERLAWALGRPLLLDQDRARVSFATLLLLCDQLRVSF